MSQYGAYGYALHGAGYKTILAHYYQGTALATTNPRQTVRVLLATGSGVVCRGHRRVRITHPPRAATTYTVRPAGAKLAIVTAAGKPVGTFASAADRHRARARRR